MQAQKESVARQMFGLGDLEQPTSQQLLHATVVMFQNRPWGTDAYDRPITLGPAMPVHVSKDCKRATFIYGLSGGLNAGTA